VGHRHAGIGFGLRHRIPIDLEKDPLVLVAPITGLVSRCHPLDVVWGSLLPGGTLVESWKPSGQSFSKHVGPRGYVPHESIALGSSVAPAYAHFEIKPRLGLALVTVRAAPDNVAVADAAGHFLSVNVVSFQCGLTRSRRRMAIHTARPIEDFIAGFIEFPVSVHFLFGVTVRAPHLGLLPVHVSGKPFVAPEELGSYPTAVATVAGQLNGRRLEKPVSFQQPSPGRLGPAHVTIAAGGVAPLAALLKQGFNLGPLLARQVHETMPKSGNCEVKARGHFFYNFSMTALAILLRLLRWPGDESSMGRRHLPAGGISSMTVRAAQPLRVFVEKFLRDKNSQVRLPDRGGSPRSTFSFVFRGGRRWGDKTL